VIETLPDDDLNTLGELLSGDDIIDLANGLDVKRVAAKLMLHPMVAVRIASRLI